MDPDSMRSFGISSRGVIGIILDSDDDGEFPDAELVDAERGLELICKSSEAAVSSSGVQVGDTVGEADTDLRCCCLGGGGILGLDVRCDCAGAMG